MMNEKKKNICISESKQDRARTEWGMEHLREFLESYRKCRKICDAYKDEYREGLIPRSEAEQREKTYLSCYARCTQVEAFIASLLIEPEKKKMLELHYIKGYTVEHCADQLYLSRSTAFRVKKRAELSACTAYFTFCERKELNDEFLFTEVEGEDAYIFSA